MTLLRGILLSVMWTVVWGQSVPPETRFEVATLKVNHSSEPESGSIEHGRLTIRAATLKHLIAAAYEIRVDLVTGGPSWVDVDRFDVEAKADPNASEHMSRVMLQRLLSECLKLAVHRQKRQTRVLVLTIAKGGPKLTRSSEDSSVRSRCFGTHPLTCTKRTMAEFADVLPRISSGIETPVVDETGLDGRYDFKLMFAQPNPRGQAETASESPRVRRVGMRMSPFLWRCKRSSG